MTLLHTLITIGRCECSRHCHCRVSVSVSVSFKFSVSNRVSAIVSVIVSSLVLVSESGSINVGVRVGCLITRAASTFGTNGAKNVLRDKFPSLIAK